MFIFSLAPSLILFLKIKQGMNCKTLSINVQSVRHMQTDAIGSYLRKSCIMLDLSIELGRRNVKLMGKNRTISKIWDKNRGEIWLKKKSPGVFKLKHLERIWSRELEEMAYDTE